MDKLKKNYNNRITLIKNVKKLKKLTIYLVISK